MGIAPAQTYLMNVLFNECDNIVKDLTEAEKKIAALTEENSMLETALEADDKELTELRGKVASKKKDTKET